MKKAHKLFLIQISVAVVLFVVLASLTKTFFYKDENIKGYLAINDGVKEMAGTSSDFLDTLIVRNDVTFDPTSGKELERVFKHLKYSNKEKFLFVGSSQLRVIQGENTSVSYESLVTKKFEKFSNGRFQVYNLSLGGMSNPEKLIVSKKASEVLKPENVLISVTPWDCLLDKIRLGVTTIENQKFTNRPNLVEDLEYAENDLLFPLNVNQKITERIENTIDKSLTIYSKRTGIKQWLNDEFEKAINPTNDSLDNTNEVPTSSIADYWLTLHQDLDNRFGWDNKVYKTGKRSLKIVNAEGKRARWLGTPISLEIPTETFEFEGWSKSDSVTVSKTGLYAIDYQITFIDDTKQWYLDNLIFENGTHDWEQVKTTVTFDKKVKTIKPVLMFFEGKGTVWFDDIKAFPIIDGIKSENIIPNPSAEIELTERQDTSYTYSEEEWVKIRENIFSVIDYLSSNQAENKYLLLTPFWHTDKKSAYPQKAEYENLVNAVKQYCEQKNVKCIDASYILNEDDFGIYAAGSVRDKIDVLHFGVRAHEELAKFIIEKLN
ncbi:hypothetical protein FEE95_03790 [Maribacter algarum]|uniref:Uncharacterized protein n=1 Tax=Maribacter algarum (ex Zhang et al. 2020) TaxID=2578118 RepID=A0A5S3QL32_9FLAO|nr:hypothetical protein [Maribacter algarum]TMM58564.1 hypothetical protein FEE95_03790 [Maribacter algarum]